MIRNRTFKYTTYKVPSDSPFGWDFVTVITDYGQRAKAPCKGAKRIDSFYGQTTLSRDEMERTFGYILQSEVA